MDDQKGSVTRTLTIVLPEPEWQALRSAEPDAIGWLHQRIRERVGAASAAGEPPGRDRGDGWSGRDEY